jgi:hypothetical protein
MNYTEIAYLDGTKVIERLNDNGTITYIPTDPTNSDYQRYLNPEADQPIGGNK